MVPRAEVFCRGAPICSGDIWFLGAVVAEPALGYRICGRTNDEMTFQNAKEMLRPGVLDGEIEHAFDGCEIPHAIVSFTTLLRQMFT
jgi:hypothetical protein